MSTSNSIHAMMKDVTGWRHHIHRYPELQYDVYQTADFVAGLLRDFGCDEVIGQVGQTGVIGVIRGQPGARTIGLRSEMDALPIQETTGAPYSSVIPGKMHACGHDGHAAMLLGAAKHLCKTRRFHGTVAVIFQPAEEGGAGAKAMLEDGLLERFAIQEVYGMHNMPGLPAGHFAMRAGPIMAATDTFDIDIVGRGGHAAKPHECIDPIVIAAQIVTALQTIVSRNDDPLKQSVVSVTTLKAGDAYNVIPQRCLLQGTCRSLEPDVRTMIERRLVSLATSIAAGYGATANVTYQRNYPVTINHAREVGHCATVACEVVGSKGVNTETPPSMGGEDFAYMLQACPGAFVFIGNGPSAGLHHPAYDFNDAIIPVGIDYWTKLAEARLKDCGASQKNPSG